MLLFQVLKLRTDSSPCVTDVLFI